ncbi:MAG: site-specific integrase [Bacteroidales bacterium]|nr:site-specific integrase [Bacteroidales bacterium]
MDTFIIKGITGRVLHDTRRGKKSGLYPVKYCITRAEKRMYYKTGYDLSKDEWTLINKKYPPEDLRQPKEIIENGLKIIETAITEILENGEYSHEKLNRRLRNKSDFIIDAYKNRIAELTRDGQVGTASIYNSAMVNLKGYNELVRFNDITPKWLKDYENYALKSIRPATVSIYLRTLRTIFNIAIQDKVILKTSYPFSQNRHDKKFKIRQGSGSKIALTIDQLAAVAEYETLFKATQRSRDLFMLSFHLGGMNLKDMLLLKWKMIKNNELMYVREKTAKTTEREIKITIPLTDEALKIIGKWGNADKSPDAHILPFMPDDPTPEDIRRITLNYLRIINKHLADIGNNLKIEGLSSMVARHTYATLAKNAGVSISFIKEVLGHTDVRTTEAYLKSFEASQRREQFTVAGNMLQKKLNAIQKKNGQ